jgi:hypothetical protein
MVAGVGFGVVRHYLAGGGRTSEIPLDEIVRRYQASTSISGARTSLPPTTATTQAAIGPLSASSTTATSIADSPSVLPEPGVYVYVTIGHDSIDAATGAQHDYPSTTTITVTPSGCGVSQRWDVAAERWQSWQRCAVEAGVAEMGRVNHDEFFNIGQTDAYECTGDPRPLEAPPGTTWTHQCREGSHIDVHTGTVIGVEDITLGDSTVHTLHVQVSVDNGRESDRQTTDSWYKLGTDLLLVQSASNHTTNDTNFGVVHYTEEYEIRLTSLRPIG